MENQLEWHKEWFRSTEGSLKIYVNSLQNLRIDPSYYPYRRQYSWADFEKVVQRNPFALNFPFIQSPEHFTKITEEWMSKHCMDSLKKFAYLPKYAIQMYCKFLRLLLICFNKFKDARCRTKRITGSTSETNN